MTPGEALQAWLALEHEAVWMYPVVGARVDSLVKIARTSFSAHRDTRDALVGRLRSRGTSPVAAALGYDVGPLTSDAEARAAAQSLEARISSAILTLAGVAEGDLRAYAVTALRTSALAEQTWGATQKAFPGLP
ncbi:MAG: ferritin-like domain-containing protein [Aeromicrobium sp.]